MAHTPRREQAKGGAGKLFRPVLFRNSGLTYRMWREWRGMLSIALFKYSSWA